MVGWNERQKEDTNKQTENKPYTQRSFLEMMTLTN
jgi:hypothetical protein